MDKGSSDKDQKVPHERPLSKSEATTLDFDKPDLLVGTCLEGRFQIEKNLTDAGADAGGIGVVYLATDVKLLGRKVVVKILREDALKFNDIVRKFLHEKEALARLDHPGIVRILDSGDLSDGNPFIVMEYIEGYSLRKAMQRQAQLPLHVVANLIESFTDALAMAHSKQVLHRDVKPENIMLTPVEGSYDRVRLIDFGIAKVGQSQLAPETQISRAIGTVLYIAPEQLVGRHDLTPAADIYSSAIVIYEMLTGDLPFKPKSMAEMYKLQSEGLKTRPRTLRADLPTLADELILQALEFEPEKRPQNIREFGRDLARALKSNLLGYMAPISVEDDEFLHSIKTEFYPALQSTSPVKPSVLEPAAPPSNKVADTDAAKYPVPGNTLVEELVPRQALKLRRRRPVLMGTTIMFLILASGIGGYYYFGSNVPTKPAAATETPLSQAPLGTPIEMKFFLTVQKMRDKKPFQEPFISSGREIFETGWQFGITCQIDSDGFLYVVNEGLDENGQLTNTMLFPTPRNQLKPNLFAGKPIETSRKIEFTGSRGDEVIWIIWTRTESDELKTVMASVDLDNGGRLKEAGVAALNRFIEANQNPPPSYFESVDGEQTVIKSNGDVLVRRLALKHR